MIVKEITVGFKATLPTNPYGSVVIDTKVVADLEAGEVMEVAMRDLYRRIRGEVLEAVKPMVAARVAAYNRAVGLLPADHREAFIHKFGVIAWLAAVMPETAFAAQEEKIEHAN